MVEWDRKERLPEVLSVKHGKQVLFIEVVKWRESKYAQ